MIERGINADSIHDDKWGSLPHVPPHTFSLSPQPHSKLHVCLWSEGSWAAIQEMGHKQAVCPGQMVSLIPWLRSHNRYCCLVPEKHVNQETKVPVPKSLQTTLGRAEAIQQQLEQRHSCMCC